MLLKPIKKQGGEVTRNRLSLNYFTVNRKVVESSRFKVMKGDTLDVGSEDSDNVPSIADELQYKYLTKSPARKARPKSSAYARSKVKRSTNKSIGRSKDNMLSFLNEMMDNNYESMKRLNKKKDNLDSEIERLKIKKLQMQSLVDSLNA